VNALGWALSHSDEFVTATEAFIAAIERRLRPGPAEGEVERLLGEKEALESFVRAALALQSGESDPAHLPQACDGDGTPIANYYVLRIALWRGYYWLNHAVKVGVGLLALHESHDLSGTLKKALEEALGKAS
jgi:hypothetical protein